MQSGLELQLPHFEFCGFAVAHCGKALPYRFTALLFERLRLRLRRSLRIKRRHTGKPEAYRIVLRQSRKAPIHF
jgi:hypothetical protein